MEKFKFLEHTADIKFQAFGKSIEEVFENSALAMFNAMYDGKVKEKKSFKINVKGKDFESLLYNFLEEVLYLLEAENFLSSKIENISIDKKKLTLKAIVKGDNASSYSFTNPVTAITYNEMFVKQEKNKWIVQVVLDV